MGQDEILNYLESHKQNWYSSRKLMKELDCGKGSISTGLRKLFLQGCLFVRDEKKEKHNYRIVEYKYKRR